MVYYEKRLRALCSEPLTCPALRGARTRLSFRCCRFTVCLLCTFFCICLCVILGCGVDGVCGAYRALVLFRCRCVPEILADKPIIFFQYGGLG